MPSTTKPRRARLARWVLLLAVIAGVFGMHVLTGGDGPGHGMLPSAMPSGHRSEALAADPVAETVSSAPSMAALPPWSGHEDTAGCILFLVVGGAALLLVALARMGSEADERTALAARLLRDVRRRGPPDGWPRIALNVIRV